MCRRGVIEAIGFDADIKAVYRSAVFDSILDATDKCVIPGKNTVVCLVQPPVAKNVRKMRKGCISLIN